MCQKWEMGELVCIMHVRRIQKSQMVLMIYQVLERGVRNKADLIRVMLMLELVELVLLRRGLLRAALGVLWLGGRDQPACCQRSSDRGGAPTGHHQAAAAEGPA